MANFQLPRTLLTDANGKPVAGAVLHFYLSGTSTPLNVYSDEANTIPLGASVVADASGRFAPIYLDTDYLYKVVAVDANGATIYTADPVEPLTTATASVSGRLLQLAQTPLDYGALGDGVADEQSAVQDAVDAAPAAGTSTVDLCGLTYRCDTPIVLPSNIRFYNGTLDFSLCTTDHCILVQGTYPAQTILLSANASVGATTLTLNNSGGGQTGTQGMSAGQWLRLYDGSIWYGTLDCGELVCIKSVDSATQLTLTRKTLGSYTTAAGALVAALATKSDIRIHDLVLIGAQSVTQSAIACEYAHKLELRNIWCKGFYTAGLDIRTCANVDISNCVVTNTRDATFGTGIIVQHGCVATTVRGCKVETSTIGIQVGKRIGASGGVCITRDVVVSDCYVAGSSIAAISVQAAHRTSIHSCEIVGSNTASSDGIGDNGVDTSITGCKVRHPVRYGIISQPKYALTYATAGGGTPSSKSDLVSCAIRGNTIEFAGSDAVRVTTDASGVDLAGYDISGNSINGAGGCGINVLVADKNVSDVAIVGNILRDCTSNPVALNVSASRTLARCTVAANTAHGHANTVTGVYALVAASGVVTDLNVSNNRISGGLHGVYASVAGTMSLLNISGNSIQAPDQVGVGAGATGSGAISRVAMSGNIVNDAAGTSSAPALYVAAAAVGNVTDVAITGNSVYKGYFGIQCSGVTGLAVSGNTLVSATSTGIRLFTCSSASVSANVVRSAGGSGIYATATSAAVSHLSIANNSVLSSGGNGIKVEADAYDITRVSLTGNVISTSTDEAIELASATSKTISAATIGGNTIQQAGAVAAIVLTCAGALTYSNISNNTIERDTAGGAPPVGGSGIVFEGAGSTTYVMVANNFVHKAYIGVSETMGTVQKVVVAGNYFAECTSTVSTAGGAGAEFVYYETLAAAAAELSNIVE
jgi:hypothetical protein